MAEAILLNHLVNQIQVNVDLLVSQNYISAADGAAIMAKLPAANVASTPAVTARSYVPAAPVRSSSISTSVSQCKALWSYNEDGSEPNDLSFSAGEVIEIVEEVNTDWWKGRCRGRTALFPSAYVERLAPVDEKRWIPPAPSVRASSDRPVYKPFGAALHGSDLPPPGGGATNSVGLQEASGQEAKKSKYGKYGNTMAHSAASGLGAGVGMAVGGGLVRAIF